MHCNVVAIDAISFKFLQIIGSMLYATLIKWTQLLQNVLPRKKIILQLLENGHWSSPIAISYGIT